MQADQVPQRSHWASALRGMSGNAIHVSTNPAPLHFLCEFRKGFDVSVPQSAPHTFVKSHTGAAWSAVAGRHDQALQGSALAAQACNHRLHQRPPLTYRHILHTLYEPACRAAASKRWPAAQHGASVPARRSGARLQAPRHAPLWPARQAAFWHAAEQ